jgi:alanyl aminopeptidase
VLQLPRDVRPTAYRLALEVVPDKERFSGEVEIDVDLEGPRSVIWLHGRDLNVTAAEVVPVRGAAMPARYEQVNGDGLSRLVLPAPIAPGRAVLRLSWSASFGDRVGLYRAREGKDWYAATLLEPVGARRAFPGFDDPFFKAPFDVVLTVPSALVAVTNGSELGRRPSGEGMSRIEFRRTPPLPTYLLFLAVGPFDVEEAPLAASDVRHIPLPVRGLAPRGRGGELAWSLQASNRLLLDLERYFGIPFPYEKLDHVAVPSHLGAMENAGAIAYEPDLFLTSPSVSEARRQRIGVVVAHEIAHQWFGDLVTPAWWTEIWLNESFATWMGIRSAARTFPSWRKDLRLVEAAGEAITADGLHTAGPVREPLRSISDVEGQFDAIRYQKGGAVLSMLEGWMGEAAFRTAIQRYLVAHAHGTGSTAALLREMSTASGRDVPAVASTFLDQAGVPLVEARVSCEGKTSRLTLTQSRWLPLGTSRSGPQQWQVPVCFRYGGRGPERERCELMVGPEATFPLEGGCPEWLMPNAGGRGYYTWSLAPRDLDRLVRRGLVHLTAAEKISLAQAVEAARRSGALPYEAELRAMMALARDPDGRVARLPIDFFSEARETLVPDSAVPDVETVVRRLYRPALERLGWDPRAGEPVDDTTFRGDVVAALVQIGRDPAVARQAAARGRLLVGYPEGTVDPGALAPDLHVAALEAFVRSGGPPGFDAILDRFEALPPTLRGPAREGLAFGTTPALGPRAVSLWRDRRLGEAERFHPLYYLMKRRATREATLAEIERNVDQMLAEFGTGIEAAFPHLTADACSRRDAERIQALFAPRAGRYPGMARVVEKVVDAVSGCAAQREAAAGPAARTFQEAARGAPLPGPGKGP